jgi:hypothetical protein
MTRFDSEVSVMMAIKACRSLGLALAAAAFAEALVSGSSEARAARSYEFSGKVTGVRGDTIAVSRGLETLEFDRGSIATGVAGMPKVGDEITIRYRLEAQSVESRRSKQQPGEVAPEANPLRESREKKQIIIDDRAFYDAGNGAPVGDPSRPGA